MGGTARPSYNTGDGFFVAGGKLYDPSGFEFRIRGVNKLHWDAASPGIPKTHANTERWVVDFTQPTATNLALMQQSINAGIVPMPGNWDGTCKEDSGTLMTIADTWVAQATAWKTLDKYMILNIANEWGPSASTAWRDAYITAIAKLRGAGYLCTISITAGGCGQDNPDLVMYAADVFNSDPQKNVIFDQHIYGNWSDGGGASWQQDLKAGLDGLVGTGMAVIVGEFGPGRNIGPSPTLITPTQIMQACEAHGIGWMAWAWDDPAYNADDSWFALSLTGDYNSSADLTMYGKEVVEGPTYGLLALAKPAKF
jgi:mannan endo-1,4-beta-mannosidase